MRSPRCLMGITSSAWCSGRCDVIPTTKEQRQNDMVVHGHLTAHGFFNSDELITGVADPVNPTDGVNKRYVDALSGGEHYVHTQSALSMAWTVEHDLGRHPAVHVEDAVGNVIHGSVQHLDDSVLVIEFAISITGTAVCT